MPREPAVRASAVRDTLAFLDRFEEGARERVLSRVPRSSRTIIEETPRSAWIGVEHDHYTIDAMIDLFGLTRAVQCWCDALADLVNRPLLGGFVSGMTRLFGSAPMRVISLFPKGWSLVYRDVATLSLDRDGLGRPRLTFSDVAPEIRLYSNYLHSWHGACRGFAHIAQVRGEVRFVIADNRSTATATFSWSDEGPSAGPVRRTGIPPSR